MRPSPMHQRRTLHSLVANACKRVYAALQTVAFVLNLVLGTTCWFGAAVLAAGSSFWLLLAVSCLIFLRLFSCV